MSMENALGLTGRQITRFHAPPYRADNGNLGNFDAVDHNGSVCTKATFISQGSCAYGEPKNAIALSVQ